jgi:Protein of unknown function (DUF1257)
MSHFTRMRTALRDADLLAAALREVGCASVEVHGSAQKMRGWAGQTRKAEVIVRRADVAGGASADIGFARQPDGTFEAILDSMDRHRFGTQWLPRLNQAYGHAAALKYARDQGYEVVTDEAERDGTRRLTLRRIT